MATNKIITRTLELTPHQIILRPLVSEKGIHKATRNNRYAFEVHPIATKTEIKQAIEELFNVKVVGVATQNRNGKIRRSRFGLGVTKRWKKAIVKLGAEHKIDFF
ncbi:MAG: 50S ribosomal protein L23 [Pirellulaceae bacterium]|nr:50S ribosomal protein L23 [Pirellulaceae bacterium]